MFKAKINLLKWKNAQGEDPNAIFYNSKDPKASIIAKNFYHMSNNIRKSLADGDTHLHLVCECFNCIMKGQTTNIA